MTLAVLLAVCIGLPTACCFVLSVMIAFDD